MYFRQPRYYNEFHCIGGDCPDNCCYGWRIDWNKDEVDKVLNAPNISPELKSLAERSFVPDENKQGRYIVEFDERGKCPCVTEDGLCRIQKELGVEYLSYTCQIYPRCAIGTPNIFYRSCNSSCRVIMEHFFNEENAVELVNIPIKGSHPIRLLNSMKESEAFLVLKY